MNRYYLMAMLSLSILPNILTASAAAGAAEYESRPVFKSLGPFISLPTNEIRNLYQDRDGYIWISTYNGLVRYDGYSSVSFTPEADGNGKPIDCFVNTVTEDTADTLWIGTQNGLYTLDKSTEKIEAVQDSILGNCNVEAVICSRNGDIWIGSNRGLYRHSKDKDRFILCDTFIKSGKKRSFMDVKTLLEDADGHIWIGTWEQGLYRYDPYNDRFHSYNGLNSSGSAHSLYQDRDGNIWIGTWRHGLLKMLNPYDMEKYSFQRFSPDPEREDGLPDDIIYAMSQDPVTGKLWIGSRNALSIMDSEENGGAFYNIYRIKDGRDVNMNQVDAILCSREGVMWVGMLGSGIFKYNTAESRFSHEPLESICDRLHTSTVRCVAQRGDGKLWLGIMGYGLILYDLEDKSFTSYNNIPAFSKLPYISGVNEIIYRKRSGEWCFATIEDGVWLYSSGKVRRICPENYPELPDVCIYSLFEDSRGNLWVGTRLGLMMVDREEKMHSISTLAGNELPPAPVYRLAEDRNGRIWAATGTDGVWKITRKDGKYTVKKYNSALRNSGSMNSVCICADKSGRIWNGTSGNGLEIYDVKNDRFVPALKNHLYSRDDIFSMLEDDKGSIWLTSSSGMYHITMPQDGREAKVHLYTTEDGLQDRIFIRNSCYKGKGGTLIFGGANGLNIFNPEKIGYDSNSYPVLVTDMRILGRSLREMDSKTKKEISDGMTLGHAGKIRLRPGQNNFTIDFAMLNYINPARNRFEYRLTGYDKEWIQVGISRHSAYYSGIPSGDYVFEVRGANPNGTWSRTEGKIDICICPPLWRNPASLCAIILTISGILLAIGIRRKVMKARERKEQDATWEITRPIIEPKSIEYTSPDEEFLKKALDCINGNLDNGDFDSAAFVQAMGMSRTWVADRIKELTGMTISTLISDIRLNTAMKFIRENRKIRTSELAYMVGFNDPKYFSQCFKKKFGKTPKEYMTTEKK